MHLSLINLPRFEIHRPPMALGILSAMCSARNISHDCLDLNLSIYQTVSKDIFEEIDDFCITGNISASAKEMLIAVIDKYIQLEYSTYKTSVFCLSLLSTWSQNVCEIVCERIRALTDAEILLGGQGLANQQWVVSLKDKKLIDNYIIGEGEITFDLFLLGQCTDQTPGFNNYNFEQIEDLARTSVIPDYTKLNIEQYPYLEKPELYITGSRGCVRRCSYCDIGHQWKKYRYRNGKHIAEEMIRQYERHNVTNFFFTDSLVNGSMKMLDDLCNTLIEYRQQHQNIKFMWKGQYIFRPKDQIKEEHIAKLKEAGADYLIVGLETGSDKVRYEMDKKHTTDDAEWFLEMFKKYDIKCHLLMLTGYVTETLEDHYQTIALFKRWQKFVASGTIVGIELGSTLSILEHSPVGQKISEYEISMIDNKPYLWTSGVNPDLTIAERVRRRVEIHKEAMSHLWPITRSAYRLSTIKHHLIETIEHFQSSKSKKSKTIPIISSSFLE